ncbi:MAG: saccharopine dehydrogenase C-terminal domain-containing protein [Candidatus Bathycorpusculaceae bacterium]
MKVLVLGCGNIGSVAAEDLANSLSSMEIVVGDINANKARAVAKKIDVENVSWIRLDTANRKELFLALEDFDLVMGFLPGKLGYSLVEACIEVGKNLVDVSYMAENPLALNDKAERKGVTVVPDCGLAPGISNILVGHAAKQFDKVQIVHVMVGGLPENPVPPLGYIITWSAESLIDEYTRRARIVKGGKKVVVDALSGLEEVDFPGLGKLEAFYTDGLRTLMYTMEDTEEMWEKTLRYSGHVKKIKFLKDLGFFEEGKVNVNGVDVSPRRFTIKLFERKLSKPRIQDIVALKVEVAGFKHGEKRSCVYHLLDRYDESRGITAMARTTAYPASIVAQLILNGTLRKRGVIPPEKIGMDDEFFSRFMNELIRRGINIVEKRG